MVEPPAEVVEVCSPEMLPPRCFREAAVAAPPRHPDAVPSVSSPQGSTRGHIMGDRQGWAVAWGVLATVATSVLVGGALATAALLAATGIWHP